MPWSFPILPKPGPMLPERERWASEDMRIPVCPGARAGSSEPCCPRSSLGMCFCVPSSAPLQRAETNHLSPAMGSQQHPILSQVHAGRYFWFLLAAEDGLLPMEEDCGVSTSLRNIHRHGVGQLLASEDRAAMERLVPARPYLGRGGAAQPWPEGGVHNRHRSAPS